MHAFAQSLPLVFWALNALAFGLVVSARLARSTLGTWAGVGALLILIASGNLMLVEMALGDAKVAQDTLLAFGLKAPTLTSSLLWGGFGVTFVAQWLTSNAPPTSPLSKN